MIVIMVIATISNIAQTVPFHLTTFTPSSGPKGSRLNVASTVFIKHINPTISPNTDIS